MIERFNRTLGAILSKTVDLDQKNWDVRLPYAMLAYRSSIHSATGFSPFEVLHGFPVRLPVDMLMPEEVNHRIRYGEFIRENQDRLIEIRDRVKWNCQEVAEKMKCRFDRNSREDNLIAGDQVWVMQVHRKKGLSPKLQPRWEGPFSIIQVINAQLVKIMRRGKQIVVHRAKIKKHVSVDLES